VKQTVRAGLVLIARELRRLVADPAALLSIVVAPFFLAVIAGVSLGAPVHVDATIAIAGIDARSLPASVADANLRVRAIDADQAEAAVRSGKATVAIIVPSDPTQPVRVISDEHAKIPTEVATSIARTIDARRAVPGGEPAVVTQQVSERRALHGIEIYGPVAAVFFVLFGVGFVSRSIQLERLDGTLARVLASPIRPSVVLMTKIVIMFLVGIFEISVVVLGTSLLFGARWGNPLAVIIVMLAIVCAGVAIATAIAGIATSPNQSHAIEFAISMLLVAIGGHMVPLQNLPDVASTIARFTPNGAALDAVSNVASGAPFGSAIGSELGVIFLFTAIVGIVGATRFRKALVL
jgi:ABC-2 type transport system permease protein